MVRGFLFKDHQLICGTIKRFGTEGDRGDSNLLGTKITISVFIIKSEMSLYRSLPSETFPQLMNAKQAKGKGLFLSEEIRMYLQFISSFIELSFGASLQASAPIRRG